MSNDEQKQRKRVIHLTDEELEVIERKVNALVEQAKQRYPKLKNESQKRYAHRIDLIVSRLV